MEFMSAREAADKWGISQRRVAVLCSEQRIKEATMVGNMWIIPSDAVKPADKRLKGEVRISSSEKKVVAKSDKKLPLPIGISDYRKASSEYYYVDKTLLIKELFYQLQNFY